MERKESMSVPEKSSNVYAAYRDKKLIYSGDDFVMACEVIKDIPSSSLISAPNYLELDKKLEDLGVEKESKKPLVSNAQDKIEQLLHKLGIKKRGVEGINFLGDMLRKAGEYMKKVGK